MSEAILRLTYDGRSAEIALPSPDSFRGKEAMMFNLLANSVSSQKSMDTFRESLKDFQEACLKTDS